MFGNMFDKLQEQRSEMQKALQEKRFSSNDAENLVFIEVSGDRKVTDVRIDTSNADKEQLEDLLIVQINEALQKAAEAEAELAKESIKGMLPPGFDGLNNLF